LKATEKIVLHSFSYIFENYNQIYYITITSYNLKCKTVLIILNCPYY